MWHYQLYGEGRLCQFFARMRGPDERLWIGPLH